MYWQETDRNESITIPDDVVDIAYQIRCKVLPVDHAWALSQAVLKVLPWIEDEPGAGVHSIHVAESGNGWQRPDGPDDLLYLSRRTRLVVRVPRARLAAADGLIGQTLNVSGHSLTVEQGTIKPLVAIQTIFSRYVVSPAGEDENTFLQGVLRELGGQGIHPKKMLCGIEKDVATPEQPIHTRSLMLADLSLADSLRLQRHGLGPRRSLGCGLFLPHKDIRDVKQVLD